jgi:hypothetical protein
LDKIEAEEIAPLEAGLVRLVVGMDQDPNKMDFEKILGK